MKLPKLFLLCLFLFTLLLAITPSQQADANHPQTPDCVVPANPCQTPLPLPSKVGDECYEKLLGAFLQSGCYKGWMQDREIRNTGPFIDPTTNPGDGKSYGVHPAVKVYYSPEIWNWMIHERRGEIPDGAMIIKEQYPMPAQQTITKDYALQGYSIMVKDKNQSWDGWYWSSGAGLGNPYKPPFNYPWAGFGQYCVNCHASTDLPESTYATLRNVVGDPITYLVVQPTMNPAVEDVEGLHERVSLMAKKAAPVPVQPPPSEAFIQLYNSIKPSEVPQPQNTPPETYDHVVQGPQPAGQKQFITSDQCIGCHDATQNNSSLPNMVYTFRDSQTTINLSPYGEWRYSMMGLSGRDPIFFSQLETERTLHPELADQIDNKCLSCHGVMGQRQFTDDHKNGLFTHKMMEATPDNPQLARFATYGGLGRDGVSCMVCHRILPDGLGTPETYTGQFKVSQKPDEIFGPFEDVITLPMKNALGLTPLKTKDDQIRTAALCGSCHTVNVPVLNVDQKYPPDAISNPQKIAHEQTTYFEWRNSIYSDEMKPVPPTAKTCQNCHMPDNYKSDTLKFRIASIEDDTFPFVDNRAPDSEITLKTRGGQKDQPPYSRHSLHGINLFAQKMFSQYWDSLGIRTTDPMATFGNPQSGIATNESSVLEMASKETAQVDIMTVKPTRGGIEATVKITNLAGHKFPSGVGFRRAFVEFLVLDEQGKPLWASGRTDEMGVILDGLTNKRLPTEFFEVGPDGKQMYQKYHSVITAGSQVQIYEELTRNNLHQFTTSFLSLDHHAKDTRLMPKGWRKEGPEGEITKPDGGDGAPVGQSYYDGSGSDIITYRVALGGLTPRAASVVATIYYQTIPPYYLQQRFTTAPDKQATRNLWYYGSRLQVNAPGSPLSLWKLKIISTSKKIG